MSFYDNTLLLFDANAGLFERVDGVMKFVRSAYDLSSTHNNLDGSATATVQPRLVGGLAPNSKYAASNQSGEARKFIHTLIDRSSTGIWSIASVINLSGNSETNRVIASDSTGTTLLKSKTTTNVFSFTNSSGTTVNGTVNNSAYIGKSTRWLFVANGTTLKIYANGILFDTLTVSTVAKFDTLFTALNAKIYQYYFFNAELLTGQISSYDSFALGLYPAMESVVIGTQEWTTRNYEAVATPMGNVIAEMQAATALEKLTTSQQQFNASYGAFADGSMYISLGVLNYSGATDSYWYFTPSGFKNTTYYKISFDINIATNAVILIDTGSQVTLTSTGRYEYIRKSTSVSYLIIRAYKSGGSFTIDNISVKELGWSNATEIYDSVYAATAGTAAEKHYAACKEAGFWCYYNNSTDNGATYGKLYNWYAASLIDLDMASAGFGWRVPTSTQFTTLQTYLGGATVAGGKLKMTGTNYWTTPNTGADNSSGFTAIAGGQRTTAGAFANLTTNDEKWTYDKYTARLLYDSAALSLVNLTGLEFRGLSLRLIKI